MAEALPLRKTIEELASEIRESAGRRISFPVNVERIVDSLGGKIAETSVQERTKEKYRRGVLKTGEKSFVLQVYSPYAFYEMDPLIHENGYLPLSLLDWRISSHGRHEITHLLGHLFLHMGFKDERWKEQEKFRDVLKYMIEDHPRLEMEANHFAQSLLMPEDEFRKIAQENVDPKTNTYFLRRIAGYFHVPPLAVERYGERLGIFRKEELPPEKDKKMRFD